MDLKGFDHAGAAWSWPEFEEPSGKMLRPAQAWASEGMTACGEAWPHTSTGRQRRAGESIDDPPQDIIPKRVRVEQIRDAEDRTVYLCAACRTTLEKP